MVERKEAQDEGRLFRVRVCRITNGERLPLVVGPDHLPVSTPNQWMLLLRRPQVQAGTLTCEMRTIAHVHEWAARRGIDLDERFRSGNGLAAAMLDLSPRTKEHSSVVDTSALHRIGYHKNWNGNDGRPECIVFGVNCRQYHDEQFT